MYAIFRAKGKQFRAEPDATLRIPSLDLEPGERITFDEVLLAADGGEVSVGTPAVEGASVEVEVVRHGRGRKIIVYKMKRRKGYRRKQGHRQKFTEVRIVDIDVPTDGGARPARKEEPKAEEAAVDVPEATVDAPEAEATEPATAGEAETAQPESEVEGIEATDAARELADEHDLDLTQVEGTGQGGRILKSDVEEALQPEVTDAARELAAEHGLELSEIEGTGEGGRILKGDVQEAIRARDEEEEEDA